MKRLILWDIDGTLVSVGHLGAEGFDRAIENVLGRRPPGRVRMSGKTDPQIVGEYLTMLGINDAGHWTPRILSELEVVLEAAKPEILAGGTVHPGVPGVLAKMADETGVVQSVLTGNVARNAELKLSVFGLDHFVDLEVGAYGSDHIDRNKLVPIALGRVGEKIGVEVNPEQVWIVGDSPNDLACARSGGVQCLLVATGRFGLEELLPLGADATLADLNDIDSVVELLIS